MDRERQEDVNRIGVLGGLPVPAIRVSRYSLYPGASNAGVAVVVAFIKDHIVPPCTHQMIIPLPVKALPLLDIRLRSQVGFVSEIEAKARSRMTPVQTVPLRIRRSVTPRRARTAGQDGSNVRGDNHV